MATDGKMLNMPRNLQIYFLSFCINVLLIATDLLETFYLFFKYFNKSVKGVPNLHFIIYINFILQFI